MPTKLRTCLLIAVLILTGMRLANADGEISRCADLIAGADSLVQIGYLDAALDHAQSAVDLSDSSFGQKDSMTARALSALGAVYWAIGDPANAERHWLTSLSIQDLTLPPSHPRIAQTCSNLGSTHFAQGKLEISAGYYARALGIYKAALGERHHTVAVVLKNLAALYISLGRYSSAEPLLIEAIAIQESDSVNGVATAAASMRELGNAYLEQGRLNDAEDWLSRALETQNRAYLPGNPNHPEIGKTLRGLGGLYAAQGRSVEAEYSYSQALDKYERSLGNAHPDVAQLLVDIATFFTGQGRLNEADSLLSVATGVLNRSSAVCDLALCSERRAVIKAMQGDSHGADSLFLFARTILDSLLPDNHPLTLQCYNDIAIFRSLQGQHLEARELMSSVFSAQRQVFVSDAVPLPERAALEYARVMQRTTDDYLTVLLNCRDSISTWAEEIAATTLASKGLVTAIISERYRATQSLESPEAASYRDSLNIVRHALAKLRLNRPVVIDGAYADKLEKCSSDKERFETSLAQLSEEYRSETKLESITPDELSHALPPNSVAVDYVRYEHRISATSSEARYLAVVWRPERLPSVVELGSADSLEQTVAWYRSHLELFESQNPADYDAISNELYRFLWLPIEKLVDDAKLVFISPDSELNLVSFAGMKTPAGRFFIQDFALHYLSSLRELMRPQGESPISNGKLMAIGDPDFDALSDDSTVTVLPEADQQGRSARLAHIRSASNRPLLRDRNWKSLAGARSEIDAVASMWRDSHREVRQFLGEEASEENFKAHCSGNQVIHIATHGYFSSAETPRGNPESLIERRYSFENPFLRCGLVLARANATASQSNRRGIEDGILTAEEILGLDMSGTELVFLSACQTALGDIKAGEGVFGLRRAFELAGARTVVSTLWPVQDRDAADYVPKLLAAGLPLTPDAVQKVSLDRIAKLTASCLPTHPYYWAAFVVTGVWE